MNTFNSFVFSIFGGVLALLPVIAPGRFPPTGLDGTNTSALWLEVVGGAQLIIGVVALGQATVSKFADRLATIAMPTLDRSPVVNVELARKQLA